MSKKKYTAMNYEVEREFINIYSHALKYNDTKKMAAVQEYLSFFDRKIYDAGSNNVSLSRFVVIDDKLLQKFPLKQLLTEKAQGEHRVVGSTGEGTDQKWNEFWLEKNTMTYEKANLRPSSPIQKIVSRTIASSGSQTMSF